MKSLLWFSIAAALLSGCNLNPEALLGKKKDYNEYNNYSSSSSSSAYNCKYYMKRADYVSGSACVNPLTVDEIVESFFKINDGTLRIVLKPLSDGKIPEIVRVAYQHYYSTAYDEKLDCVSAPASDQPANRKVYYCTLKDKSSMYDGTYNISKLYLHSDLCYTNFESTKNNDCYSSTIEKVFIHKDSDDIVPSLTPIKS